ncbi:MAG: LysR family transcriptional regulator [Microbacteriaceae bacterium]
MELRQLECFVAVAEEASFTRAAGRLHVVQSAVSATIVALERDLHAQLLQRTSRRVVLTEAGRALLPKARAALAGAREARDAVDEVSGTVGGTLRVGTLSSLGVFDLAALLGVFHREHPTVSLHLETVASGDGSPGLIDALVDGRLDVAFVSLPGPASKGVRLHELGSTPLELVVPVGHRLARRRAVTLPDLENEPFVDFPTGYGNRALTDRAFDGAGIGREVVIEIASIPAAADFIRHGLGIALLPRGAATLRDDFARVNVTGSDLDWPISLAVPSNRNPTAAARAFEDRVLRRDWTALFECEIPTSS